MIFYCEFSDVNGQQTLGMRFSLTETQSIAEIFVITLRCFAPLREILQH